MPNDLSAFVSNPGASRWITTSPGPRIVRQNVKSAKKQQLLSEAASLVPDYAQLAEELGKKKFAPAESRWFQEQLTGMMTDYLKNYNENPYWAFTREGKEKVQKMHRHVNDPNTKLYEQLYEQSGKEHERLKNNLGLVNYNNGRVNVYNKQTGTVQSVSVDELDFRKHQGLTLEDEYSVRSNAIGFRNDPTAFSANIADYEKVVEKIDRFLAGTGKIKDEFDTGLVNVTQSGNQYQLKRKADLLKSGAGLSDDELNAVYSRYYTPLIMGNQKPDKREADKFLLNLVDQIKEGHVSLETGLGLSTSLQAKRASSEIAKNVQETAGVGLPASAGEYGKRMVAIDLNDKGTRRVAQIQVNQIPNFVLNESASHYTTEDAAGTKNTAPKRNVADLKITGSADTKNPILLTPAGEFETDPDFGKYQDQVKVSEVGLASRPYRILANGSREYLPFDMGDVSKERGAYVIGHEDDPQYGAELVMHVRGQVGAVNQQGLDYLASGDQTDVDIFNIANRYGWKANIHEKDNQAVKDYVNNVNFSSDRSESIDRGMLSWDDNVHLFDVEYFLPLLGETNHEKAINIDQAMLGTPVGKDLQVDKGLGYYNLNKNAATQQLEKQQPARRGQFSSLDDLK